MKTKHFAAMAALLAGSFLAAHADPGTDITNAVTALSGQPNYSWTTTVVVPEGSQFKPGPSTGKTEKDGYTDVSMTMRDNKVEFISKGGKVAINTTDGGWQSVADVEADQGPARYVAMMARNFKTPDLQAASLAASVGTLAKDGDVISGDLTEAGAKVLLPFRPRGGGGGGGPEISGAKGTAKFWLANGALTKFEFHVTGKVSFNGNDRDVDRDTTVEISDAGSTKVTVPDDAMKIITAKPAAAAADAAK